MVGLRAGLVLATALSLVWCGGCASRVHFTVLDSADLVLPPEVHTVAVVDRTGAPEGAAAVAGFTRWFATPERVIVPAGPADLTVSVEGFDSSSELALEERVAVRTSRVALTWRLFDRAGTELDALVDVETADRWLSARDTDGATALPSAEETLLSLATSSGVAYARRFRAQDANFVRATYARGDPRLRFAQVAVRSGDWDRAMRLWTEVARESDPALAARAHYDLAVGYEVAGEVRRALDHASRAAALDDGERFARYEQALDRANGDQRPLRPATRED